MKRWPFVILLIVTAVVLIFGGIYSGITSLLPVSQTTSVPPFVGALVATYVVLQVIANVAQVYGYTLRDILPEKSLKERDRERSKLLNSKDVEKLRAQMRKAYDAKDYDWVVAFAEALLKIRPKDTQAHDKAGTALVRSGKPEQAILHGEQLIKIDKLSHDGYELLGDAYKEMGEWDKATENYETALLYVDQGSRQFILSPLAEVYRSSGELDKAIATFEEYVQESNVDSELIRFARSKLDNLKAIKDRLEQHQES
jgi:tetratricopeptide (TPR) repeat protein